MIPPQYFNAVAIGAMIAAAAAGLPTLATASRNEEPSTAEPAFSVGLILTYVPTAYIIAGIIGIYVKTSNAVLNAILLLLAAVVGHAAYVIIRRRPAAAVDVGRAAGLTALFDSASSESLKRWCRDDLMRAKRVRLVAPNLQELFAPGIAIGEALLEAMRGGVKLEILTDGRVSAISDLKLGSISGTAEIVGIDPTDVSGHWLILNVGNIAYFGIGSEGVRLSDMPICRGASTADDQSGHIADAVLSVLEGLFDRARKGDCFSRVRTSSSPKTYRQRIVTAETGARTIDRIPKRVSVVFRGEDTIRSIAAQRFGRGSPSFNEYVEEHRERCQEFFAGLARGMICREIYNEDELMQYIKTRMHSNWVQLERSEIADTIVRWRQAIEHHQNYVVALSDDPIPFKYVLIDGRLVVLHEAIGVNYLHRLNAISVESKSVGEAFLSDFEAIWERVPPERRSKIWLLKYIDEVLMPLTREPGNDDAENNIEK